MNRTITCVVATCSIAVALGMAALAAPTHASAVPDVDTRPVGMKVTSYAALGDSSSAGLGTGLYDLAGPPCLRSSQAYGPLWATAHQVRTLSFAACSGATTADLTNLQVPALPKDTGLVTLTIGGTDVGFAEILRTCTTAPDDATCFDAVRRGQDIATTALPARLLAALTAIRRRAPRADVVVLGYPRLFELGPCPAPVPNEQRRKALNEGADVLDTVIAATAPLGRARYVDVRDRFSGHGVCAPDGTAWVNGPVASVEAYHPNQLGHREGFLAALTDVTD